MRASKSVRRDEPIDRGRRRQRAAVPERARQAVDREPWNQAVSARVDVEAPKGCEWQVVASQTDEGESGLRRWPPAWSGALRSESGPPGNPPAVEINGGNEQQPAERVEQQAGLERMAAHTSGDHRRRHELRPGN